MEKTLKKLGFRLSETNENKWEYFDFGWWYFVYKDGLIYELYKKPEEGEEMHLRTTTNPKKIKKIFELLTEPEIIPVW